MTQARSPLKPWLAASLVLNVFLIGGVAGGAYQWLSHPAPVVGPVVQHGLRQVMVQLPVQRRHELRRLLRETREQSQPLILAGRQARQDVMQQLRAPTLDRDALVADLGRARDADLALRARVETSLADFAATLPADEREQLAKSMYLRGQGKANRPQP
ncbi:periplasmic heavy metal sensor [Pseudomonas sp. App30]|uniref:periplasmic heavy metal sensor n=1 Tax=Pseudomonas sp. App30 TaxID=3068990 RepID=UPI003A8092C8